MLRPDGLLIEAKRLRIEQNPLLLLTFVFI
jgi:hypothetical protein